MAVNKVVYGGNTLIDLTGDTVDASNLLQGILAHKSDGSQIVGELIPGGGGLPSGVSKMAMGSHTLSSNTNSSFTVTHNLGVTPDLFLFYADGAPSNTYTDLMCLRWAKFASWYSTAVNVVAYRGNSTTSFSLSTTTASYGCTNLNQTTATMYRSHSSSSYYWRAGTYRWIAIKFA